MPIVYFGNTKGKYGIRDDETDEVTYQTLEGKSILMINIPDHKGLVQSLGEIKHLWNYHADAPPAWVECEESPGLLAILQEEYPGLVVGKPADWESDPVVENG